MPRVFSINSLAELRASASAWDDLWQRGDTTLPNARAELLAQWVERFEPRAEFHALVMEEQGRWMAALPLLRKRLAGLVNVGTLPSGAWSTGGQLLWDPQVSEEGGRAFADAIGRLPLSMLWLEGVVADQLGTTAWFRAIDQAGLTRDFRRRWQAPRIDLGHDWEAYRNGWSRKHRQNMAACSRRLSARGEVRLQLLSHLAPAEVEPWLRRGFLVEDRGWKGAARSSVLATPGMFDFFLRQAQQAAEWGQLELAFLECGAAPAAFVYGLTAKGVFHSCKIGYDPQYADCAPGQLLRCHLLQRFHAEPERRALDFLGPTTPAHACWRPASYTVGRLAVAGRGHVGAAALRVYRRLRGRTEVEP